MALGPVARGLCGSRACGSRALWLKGLWLKFTEWPVMHTRIKPLPLPTPLVIPNKTNNIEASLAAYHANRNQNHYHLQHQSTSTLKPTALLSPTQLHITLPVTSTNTISPHHHITTSPPNRHGVVHTTFYCREPNCGLNYFKAKFFVNNITPRSESIVTAFGTINRRGTFSCHRSLVNNYIDNLRTNYLAVNPDVYVAANLECQLV